MRMKQSIYEFYVSFEKLFEKKGSSQPVATTNLSGSVARKRHQEKQGSNLFVKRRKQGKLIFQ
jgi:hypothetical protein